MTKIPMYAEEVEEPPEEDTFLAAVGETLTVLGGLHSPHGGPIVGVHHVPKQTIIDWSREPGDKVREAVDELRTSQDFPIEYHPDHGENTLHIAEASSLSRLRELALALSPHREEQWSPDDGSSVVAARFTMDYEHLGRLRNIIGDVDTATIANDIEAVTTLDFDEGEVAVVIHDAERVHVTVVGPHEIEAGPNGETSVVDVLTRVREETEGDLPPPQVDVEVGPPDTPTVSPQQMGDEFLGNTDGVRRGNGARDEDGDMDILGPRAIAPVTIEGRRDNGVDDSS